MEWWLGDEDQAVELRRNCRLLVYPMINPDGRYGGYVRGGPACPNGDFNRMWGPGDPQATPHVAMIKQAIDRDVAGAPVLFFLDVHNQEQTKRQYMYVNTCIHLRPGTGELLPFLARMQADLTCFDFEMTESLRIARGDTTCKSWGMAAEDGPRARYSYTLEPGLPPADQVAISKRYGATAGRGIADHLASGLS